MSARSRITFLMASFDDLQIDRIEALALFLSRPAQVGELARHYTPKERDRLRAALASMFSIVSRGARGEVIAERPFEAPAPELDPPRRAIFTDRLGALVQCVCMPGIPECGCPLHDVPREGGE